MIDQLQSSHSRLTCKKHDSTESALLKVKNDILLNMDAQKVILLVLLDLSAAFDTVRHDILLDRLRSRLGVTDQALNWFTSYLSDFSARVRGAARVIPWPASVNGIYQRTIRYSGSTLAKRALLRQH